MVWFVLTDRVDRSLEEIDELFDSGISLRKFKSYQTAGLGAQITALEEAMGRGEGEADLKSESHIRQLEV
jgi:hypothetical protein